MYKKLPVVFIAICFVLLFSSCLKKISRKEVEQNLITAMSDYMNLSPHADTNKLKFNIREVTFYEERTIYRCEFKVDMIHKGDPTKKDTTGYMGANISKDYKTITRNF